MVPPPDRAPVPQQDHRASLREESFFSSPDRHRIMAMLDGSASTRITDVLGQAAGLTSTEQAITAHLLSLRQGSSGTLRAYLATFLAFFEFTQTPVTHIQVWHIEDFTNALEQAGQAKATRACKLAYLKSLFGFLHKAGLIPLNPAAPVKGPKHVHGHHGDRVLLADEITQIFEYTKTHAPARDHLLCRFLFGAGARAEEAIQPCWGDILRDARGRWYTPVTGKGDKVRTLYLAKDLVRDLMDWRQALYRVEPFRPAPGLERVPIFAARRELTRPITVRTVHRIVQKWGLAALGRTISPHWFRHSFATHARLAGATLQQVQVALGHESIQTTTRYEHSPHLQSPAGEVLEISWSTPQKD